MTEADPTPSDAGPNSGMDSGPDAAPRPAAPGDTRTARIDPRLLEILVCPSSRTRLEWRPEAQELVSRAAGLVYPVRDGVPILLFD